MICPQLERICSFLPVSSPLSTRLVFLVSGGPGRPPLSGHSVALGLRNKLRKQKNDFLIFKARRVDTVSEYPDTRIEKSKTWMEKCIRTNELRLSSFT